eukprot:TRINITY_DN4853_c0_g1_i1.p2 TRINITY_DN4853_c0_g1~~TRINITY_DN4853_c0_g1_i1.p2  ORF type:complete len:321 (+),score=173.70 TRINITY_DN4853_c0_g1_i1:41-1003(+)
MRLATSLCVLACLLLLSISLSLCIEEDYSRYGGGYYERGYENEEHEKYESSPDFYRMVEDVIAKIDYYEILEVDSNCTMAQLRKSFRKLALIHHPDKAKNLTAQQETMMKIRFAYQVLSDNETRIQYDNYVQNGIPWHTKYYARYAHKFGAPEHDIRLILVILFVLINAAHYAYGHYKYENVRRYARKTERYQRMLRERKKELGLNKKGKKKTDAENDKEIEDLLDVHIVGCEKPEWKDLIAVQMIYWPMDLFRYAKKCLTQATPEEIDEQLRSRSGMSEEEWAKAKRRQQEKEEKMRFSGKAKRMRRFMKQRDPVYFEE